MVEPCGDLWRLTAKGFAEIAPRRSPVRVRLAPLHRLRKNWGVRFGIAIAVLLVLTGCGSGEKNAAQTETKTASRIERCTQRFLDRIDGDGRPGLRSYVEHMYCQPFARKGWVYADGTLSIQAHLDLMNGGSCAASTLTPGQPATTIPCDPRAGLLNPLECAILQYVRRDEVSAYIRKLQHSQRVRCDDGTPLDKLGAG